MLRIIAGLAAGTALLVGLSACGSDSASDSATTSVKREAGALIRGMHLTIVNRSDKVLTVAFCPLDQSGAGVGPGACADSQDLGPGQTTDSSASGGDGANVYARLSYPQPTGRVTVLAANPIVGSPFIRLAHGRSADVYNAIFGSPKYDNPETPYWSLSEDDASSVEYAEDGSSYVGKRNADTDDYKQFVLEANVR